VALQSFGGPAGQIAVMHRLLVEEQRWISERRFLHALNYCLLLPGPEAQQLATYIGWLLHRTPGGLMAGTLFVLPGFLSILGLSYLYVELGDVGVVAGLFLGLKPAVLAVVVEALIRIGRRALVGGFRVALAALAFVAIFFFELPFPMIIAAAALLGWAGGRWMAAAAAGHRPEADPAEASGVIDAAFEAGQLDHARPSWRRSVRVAAICLPLWLGPTALLWALRGAGDVFAREAIFFSKAAVVTFGGAYAVLAYVAQEAVNTHGWLRPGEMLDGLGMAETTPGPLIMVVQFVGFVGAYRQAGDLSPGLAGALAAALTTWVTFVPCFLWIFLGAPYVESLRGRTSLTNAFAGITAAIVGVILNLAVWFALHTLFGQIEVLPRWGVTWQIPRVETVAWAPLAIAVLAFLMLFALRWGMLRTLLACGLVGAALSLFLGQ